jgi:hypothetical protein
MIYVIQMVELRSAAKFDQITPEIGLKGLVLGPVRVPGNSGRPKTRGF